MAKKDEIEKLKDDLWYRLGRPENALFAKQDDDWLRRRLRKLVMEAYEAWIEITQVDPHYRTKEVIKANDDNFKEKFGFKP